MFTNHLRSFFKLLLNNKIYATVTIVGFAISLTFIFLLSFYLKKEYAVNDQHANIDRIYHLRSERGDGFAPPIGQLLQDNYPEIECYTRAFNTSGIVSVNQDNMYNARFLLADSTFFKMFSFNLLQGSESEALKTSRSMVLTERFARKLFGDESPIGKTVQVNDNISFTIAGVVEDISKNTSFNEVDALYNFRGLADVWGYSSLLTTNDNCSFGLYVMEKNNADLQSKVPDMLQLLKEELWLYKQGRSKELKAESLKETYFSPVEANGMRQNSKTLLVVLSAIVFSILVLAVINYTNLTIAQSSLRAKETAIKKIIGGSRWNLVMQFLIESALVCSIALILAVVLTYLVQPYFNTLVNSDIVFYKEFTLLTSLTAIGVLLLIIGVSGMIPALVITGTNANDILKGAFRNKKKSYANLMIGFQFVVVIIMVICTLSINKQTVFLQNFDLGYNHNNILKYDYVLDPGQKVGLRNKLLSLSGVKEVSYICGDPLDGGNNQSFMYHNKPVSFQEFIVDSAFLKMMELEIIETGVSYSKDGWWINETAVKTLELDPLPHSFTRYGQELPVLGVIKDFNFRSLHSRVGPLMIGQMQPERWAWNILVQIEGGNVHQTIEDINKLYSEFNGGIPFESRFMDEVLQKKYESESKTSRIVSYFTFLTIIIAVMGMFGMSIFYMQHKIKEIGVRKVNGAKSIEVIAMLNLNLLKYVVIAYLIGVPIGWFTINKWLQNFAYKTDLSWWIFAVGGLITLFIAIVTISWQSWRAGSQNPVKALRYE